MYTRGMAKELTISEVARMGGKAVAERHSKAELERWAKQGGRPRKLTGKVASDFGQCSQRGSHTWRFHSILGFRCVQLGGKLPARQGKARKPADNA